MIVCHDYEALREILGTRHSAVTIGNFDGVHAGHKFLLRKFKKFCNERNLVSIVITFNPHPVSFIHSIHEYLVISEEDKKKNIEDLGMDLMLVLNFDDQRRQQSGERFSEEIVGNLHGLKAFFVGHDFALGANKGFGISELKRKYKKEFEIVQEKQFFINADRISSSLIRKFLAAGEIMQVNRYLKRPYSLEGEVIFGNQIGKTLGFPTANIAYHPHLMLPKAGVYFARVEIEAQYYAAAVNIGFRPTVTQDTIKTVEAHILGLDEKIYDKKIRIEFIEMIREEIKFDDQISLVNQIQKDIQQIKKKPFQIRFALIGKDITHSLSPSVYSDHLDGFPVQYVFLDIPSQKNLCDLKSWVKTYRHVSVTAPYKKYCSQNTRCTSSVEICDLGVNALKEENEEVVSTNTDFPACQILFEKYGFSHAKKIFVLGDGAMAQMILSLIADRKKVEQFSRKLSNLGDVKIKIEEETRPSELVVINTCARGYTFPEFNQKSFTFWDLNYSMPAHQELFYRKNVNYIDGEELLWLQAKLALSFWNLKIP